MAMRGRNRKALAARSARAWPPVLRSSFTSRIASRGSPARRSGRGWAYFDPDGKRITKRDEIDRLNAIALPPAYTDAWFCPDPNGHILATGFDDKGRKQYRYHPDYRTRQEAEKFDRCPSLRRLLPKVRKRVDAGSRRARAEPRAGDRQRRAAARSRRRPRRQRELRQGEQQLRRDHAADAPRQLVGQDGEAALQGQERQDGRSRRDRSPARPFRAQDGRPARPAPVPVCRR